MKVLIKLSGAREGEDGQRLVVQKFSLKTGENGHCYQRVDTMLCCDSQCEKSDEGPLLKVLIKSVGSTFRVNFHLGAATFSL